MCSSTAKVTSSESLAFLIGAAVYWLTNCIQQVELSVRERLLQLELRLAELSENKSAPTRP